MEITSKFNEREPKLNHNHPLSPTTTSTSSTNTNIHNNNNNNANNGIPITRSDPNSPYPTTFVTADTTSFKQVVQLLTGTTTTTTTTSPPQQPPLTTTGKLIPPIRTAPKKQGFKLYERRNNTTLKTLLSQNASFSSSNNSSPRYNNNNNNNNNFNYKPEVLSPSVLDFPSLTLSPVTPLVVDAFDKSGSGSSGGEEERAMAEKGFYLHPSPISTPRGSEPQLLPLFPLSSPRVSDP